MTVSTRPLLGQRITIASPSSTVPQNAVRRIGRSTEAWERISSEGKLLILSLSSNRIAIPRNVGLGSPCSRLRQMCVPQQSTECVHVRKQSIAREFEAGN